MPFAGDTCLKARVDGVVVSVATFVVAGVLEDGHRAILAVVSDSHDGLRAAREATPIYRENTCIAPRKRPRRKNKSCFLVD